VNAPVSLQAAGYEVICAYHENDDASPLDTANRLAYFSLFLGPSINWSSELWEPRFRALRALTRDGTDILGIESAVLGVLEAWIQGAFDDLLASNPPASIECAERERTLEVVAPFLTEIVSRPAIVARLQEEEVMGVLQFYAGLFDQAISCSSPAPSLAVPDSPVLAASNPSRPTHSHRRHPSSLSVSSLSQHISTPVASARRPVDLAISAYLNHLNSQLKTMSPAGLDLILPVFFRALAFYATPLPRLSINANPIRTSRIESQLSETLNALLNGPYATTCMVILKRHLHPPVHRDDKIAKSIQVTIGAQRTLRNYIRRGLSARLARAYISRSSSVNYVPSGTPSLLHLERDLMERAWPKDDVPAWDGGKLGRILCKSVEAWVAFGNEPDALCHSSGRDAIFEEAAGTLKDILEELDSRDENSMIDEEEANAVGKTLYQLASSVRQIKYVGPALLRNLLLIVPIKNSGRVRPADAPFATEHSTVTFPAFAELLAGSGPQDLHESAPLDHIVVHRRTCD
jgi:tuberous sclerosis protein 2